MRTSPGTAAHCKDSVRGGARASCDRGGQGCTLRSRPHEALLGRLRPSARGACGGASRVRAPRDPRRSRCAAAGRLRPRRHRSRSSSWGCRWRGPGTCAVPGAIGLGGRWTRVARRRCRNPRIAPDAGTAASAPGARRGALGSPWWVGRVEPTSRCARAWPGRAALRASLRPLEPRASRAPLRPHDASASGAGDRARGSAWGASEAIRRDPNRRTRRAMRLRRRPPHGRRERVLAGSRRRPSCAASRPTTCSRKRLERHRRQLPRRPVRHRSSRAVHGGTDPQRRRGARAQGFNDGVGGRRACSAPYGSTRHRRRRRRAGDRVAARLAARSWRTSTRLRCRRTSRTATPATRAARP